MAVLKINTGTITLDVERDGEIVGKFKFNPQDVLERERLINLQNAIVSLEAEYTSKTDKFNSLTPETMTVATQMELTALEKTYLQQIQAQIDLCWGDGSCEMLFGNNLNGEAVLSFIEQVIEYYQKASEEKTKRLIAEAKKAKHK